MSIAIADKVWTDEDLDAFPEDDGVERWIIDGVLWEQPTGDDMGLSIPAHAVALSAIAAILRAWCLTQPAPKPRTYSGDVRCRLSTGPITTVGTDVAVARPEQAAAVTTATRFLDGPPLVAVEILSPSDRTEKVRAKTNTYLNHGTPLVWVVDPFDQTVTVYRPGAPPKLFDNTQEITADPELPGFRCRVAEFFE